MSATVFFSSSSELATLTNVFKVAGAATDPTSVALTITSPSNVVTTPTPTHGVTGTYTADITCNEDGTWQYEWVGTGTATDTEAGTWEVLDTDLGKLYCPISMLKSRLSIDSTNTAMDYELHAACFAASRWVEQYTERIFYRTLSQTRTFAPDNFYYLTLPEYCDLVSASAVAVDAAGSGTFATTWAASDYQLLPYNPAAAPEDRPYTALQAIAGMTFPLPVRGAVRRADTVQITGIWGWPKVPMGIKQAAAIIATDLFALKDAPFGVEGQAEFTTQVGDNRRAMRLLDPYRRMAVLVA